MRTLALISMALTMAAAEPAQACSLIWPGYDGMTQDSDIVLVVDVSSVTPGQPRADAGRSLFRSASGNVIEVLKGRFDQPQATFEHRIPDVDYHCDWEILAQTPGRYWVWLDIRNDGVRTHYAVAANEISNSDRVLVRSTARQ
ncbi:hypothetical protein [Brevundimonas sp.]|uniref:hypothetical protein n=1 Tax=Brevundimonas sp. TaxID=1871086 RepID=UPI002FC9B722